MKNIKLHLNYWLEKWKKKQQKKQNVDLESFEYLKKNRQA